MMHAIFFVLQHMRMNQCLFDYLVSRLEDELYLQHTNWRQALSVPEQVAICLRFLATGDSFESVARSFRVGASTVRKSVNRVCEAIWKVLRDDYLPSPTTEIWRKNAEVFLSRWGFPHCCGAVDGKHVNVFAPPNSGSAFFNYKGFFSVVLMAVADADLRFVIVDIGDFGSNSDGGIFRRSAFGQRLLSGRLNLPPDERLGNSVSGEVIPYVFIADEAFPLGKNLMKPYPGRGLTNEKHLFNYHLSRARRVVESAFGILTQRFRIYHRKMCLLPETVVSVIKATVVLHNMLQAVSAQTASCDFSANDEEHSDILGDLGRATGPQGGCVQERTQAMTVREAFKAHFIKQHTALVNAQ